MPYQERGIWYDITQGYLQEEGGGQVVRRGVLHRGPVGASKRGWDVAWVGGSEERQEAGSSTTSGSEPGRVAHSDVEKGQGGHGKDRETNMTAGAPGPSTQAPRQVPGISKKMRPKNGDKEG